MESLPESETGNGNASYKEAKSIYDFTATDIDGNEVSLDKYRGYVCIIVNVASNCGFTHVNYTHLVDLYESYSSKGLKILAFPCNQFMAQEPGTNEEIKCFVAGYKADGKFDLFAKTCVNGDGAHPLWKYLRHKNVGSPISDYAVKWNFSKFLIDRKGQPVEQFGPSTSPLDMEKSIMRCLEEL